MRQVLFQSVKMARVFYFQLLICGLFRNEIAKTKLPNSNYSGAKRHQKFYPREPALFKIKVAESEESNSDLSKFPTPACFF